MMALESWLRAHTMNHQGGSLFQRKIPSIGATTAHIGCCNCILRADALDAISSRKSIGLNVFCKGIFHARKPLPPITCLRDGTHGTTHNKSHEERNPATAHNSKVRAQGPSSSLTSSPRCQEENFDKWRDLYAAERASSKLSPRALTLTNA